MKFETRKIDDCIGWHLAHSVTVGTKRIKKASIVSVEDVISMHKHNMTELQVFKLDEKDVAEDKAAATLAIHFTGENTQTEKSMRGRCNIIASADGLLNIPDTLNRANLLDEAITIATLPDRQQVKKGQLIATVKIIPYALDEALVEEALNITASITIVPFAPYKTALITSDIALKDKAFSAIENRVIATSGELTSVTKCAHTVNSISNEFTNVIQDTDIDLILILGASAISDRRDIVPNALVDAGGAVEHIGMPVDPGNLIMVGSISDKTVIGIPTCAKSPSLNGFDWVLSRFAARQAIKSTDIQSMGIGGLLKEDHTRPHLRRSSLQVLKTTDGAYSKHKTLIEVFILAAGKSSRAQTNKLLAHLNGTAVIAKTVESLLASTYIEPNNITVITGNESDKVKEGIREFDVRLLHNTKYAVGMSESLKLANGTIREKTDYVLIALGDMPFVNAATLDAMITAGLNNPEYDIIIPAFHGKRGNPVLWRRDRFAFIKNISGDQGGRAIIKENEAKVLEIETNDPGILIDLDTPEMLKQFGLTQNR
jgi:molybdenum cofactor cytidylyltransferase